MKGFSRLALVGTVVFLLFSAVSVRGQEGSEVDPVKLYKEGLELYQQKKWTEARQRFESAVFFQPGMEQGLYCLGLCYLMEGDIRKAIHCEKNLVELQSNLAERLTLAIDKSLPEGNAGRRAGHLPETMGAIAVGEPEEHDVESLETPTNTGATAKFDATVNRLTEEERPDDPDCRASRQAAADGILAFFERYPRKNRIFKNDIDQLIQQAGAEAEEDEEKEPLIAEKLMCPLGGGYLVMQEGRKFTVSCTKHSGPDGFVEAPEQCEPSNAPTIFGEILIPSSY